MTSGFRSQGVLYSWIANLDECCTVSTESYDPNRESSVLGYLV